MNYTVVSARFCGTIYKTEEQSFPEDVSKLWATWTTLAQSVEDAIPEQVRFQVHLLWSLEIQASPDKELFFRAKIDMCVLGQLPATLDDIIPNHLDHNQFTYLPACSLPGVYILPDGKVCWLVQWGYPNPLIETKPTTPEAIAKDLAEALVNGGRENVRFSPNVSTENDLLRGVWKRAHYVPPEGIE